MSCYMPAVGMLLGAIPGLIIGAHTHSLVGALVAILGMVGGLYLWIYSPLPTSNGGWGHPPAKKQKWGWTDEPAKEYEEPDQRDMMKCALRGINWATPKEGADD